MVSSKAKDSDCSCARDESSQGLPLPRRLRFSRLDYLRALWEWLNAFRRTFRVAPGLYYTGCCYDRNAPLLVTCNYHLTVFLLARSLRGRSVRLLVIDTAGINVWCSSGKGRFSAQQIIMQLERYPREMLAQGKTIELVLPKLSLSGVSLKELRRAGVTPRIGPIYRHHLPSYLDNTPLKDSAASRYTFSLTDRLFTLVPTLLQVAKRALYLAAAMLIWHHFFPTGIYWQVLPLVLLVAALYIILFPLLPGRSFALKGLVLFAALALPLSLDHLHLGFLGLQRIDFIFYLLFLAAASLLFALSYTGDSGVSNYSLVKKEIVRFLPLALLLLLGSLATLIVKGVS